MPKHSEHMMPGMPKHEGNMPPKKMPKKPMPMKKGK